VYFVYFVVEPLSERGTEEGPYSAKHWSGTLPNTRKRVLAGPDLAGYGMVVEHKDETSYGCYESSELSCFERLAFFTVNHSPL